MEAHNNFIGSLDLEEVDSPLRLVEEFMNRLEKSKLIDSSSDPEFNLSVSPILSISFSDKHLLIRISIT